MATLEQSVKTAVEEILKEKGTISINWIKANLRKLDFNVDEFCQVYPNTESLTLTKTGEIIATAPAVKEAVKMVKVTGNTFEAKGALKQYGFKWDADKKAWFGTEDQKNALMGFVSGLKDEYLKKANQHLTALKFETL